MAAAAVPWLPTANSFTICARTPRRRPSMPSAGNSSSRPVSFLKVRVAGAYKGIDADGLIFADARGDGLRIAHQGCARAPAHEADAPPSDSAPPPAGSRRPSCSAAMRACPTESISSLKRFWALAICASETC